MIYIAILSGVSVVVARAINAKLASTIGIFQGTIINYVTGLIFTLLFLLFSSERIGLGLLVFTGLTYNLFLDRKDSKDPVEKAQSFTLNLHEKSPAD